MKEIEIETSPVLMYPFQIQYKPCCIQTINFFKGHKCWTCTPLFIPPSHKLSALSVSLPPSSPLAATDKADIEPGLIILQD